MKKVFSMILVFVIMNIALATYADVLTIDTDTASVEEITETLDKLKTVLNDKQGKESGQHTFENGSTISVLKAEKKEDKVTVHYLYSHQEDEPSTFLIFQYSVFQNGIELYNKQTAEDFKTIGRYTLKNSPIEVTITYELIDDSPVTIYVWKRYSDEKPYITTISLS